jgi:dTDP-4-dehydrorhamnose reductase
MNILIFGASGNLGQKIAYGLRMRDISLDIIYKNSFNILIDSELDLKKILNQKKYDIVINCSALIGLMNCEKNRVEAFKINSCFPQLLGKYLNEDKTKIIHFSTDNIFYCNSANENHTENGTPSPNTWYGITKLLGENSLNKYKNKVVIRLPLLFSLDMLNDKLTINSLLRKLLNNEKIIVYNDIFNTPVPIEMIEPIIFKNIIENNNCFDLLHITSDINISLYDFICKICIIKGLNIDNIKSVCSAVSTSDIIKPRFGGLSSTKLPIISHNKMLDFL